MADIFSGVIQGFSAISDPLIFLSIVAASLFGIVFGVIPGLSAVMALTLFIPFTFKMSAVMGIVLLSAMYAAGVFGGSMTAVLFNIPGAPENAATCFDGYPMAQQGKATQALGCAIFSSALGGLFATLAMMFFAPALANVALSFGPPDFFALCFLGLCVVIGLGSSVSKGVISALVGLLLACVGVSPMSGAARLTFGFDILMSGIRYIPIMLGAFAISEVLTRVVDIKEGKEYQEVKLSGKMMEWGEIVRMKWLYLRSAVIGVVIGMLPGAGATIASFLSYNEAQRWSKFPEKFGTGIIDGVAAPETANNAASGSTLIPLFSLGIPGGAAAAIILGAFEIHGLTPGPLLFFTNPEIPNTVLASLFVANFMIIIAGFFGAKYLVKVLTVPQYIIFPIITVFCCLGAFAVGNNMFDVWVMLAFGLIGTYMRNNGYSIAGMVLGVVLGFLLETNFIQTTVIFEKNIFAGFFLRPISGTILVFSIISLFMPIYRQLKSLRKA